VTDLVHEETTAQHLGETQTVGLLGRLASAVIRHGRLTVTVWLVVIVGLGAFSPQVEKSLSGAGWQADGSESVEVRELARSHFGGNASSALQIVVHSDRAPVTSGPGAEVIAQVEATLGGDDRISTVVPPQPGATISRDQKTAVVLGGAGASTNDMVRAADDLAGPLEKLSGNGIEVTPTGSSQLWADFNAANLDAMITSELMSWPVTMAILVVAFGALVAAGLPLLLTLAGLVASAGALVLVNKVVPVSIWAMNFAMMFALALGIDYALLIVARFRAASAVPDTPVADAVAQTMDTAGKAVLLSGITVLVSLSAVQIVPSPAFRSMAGGIMGSVVFMLAATLTLLPLVLAKLGGRIDRFALPWSHSGRHRSARFAAWGEHLWRRPFAFGAAALGVLVALAAPISGLRTSMPSIKVLPGDAPARVGYDRVQSAFGPGAPGMLQIVTPGDAASHTARVLRDDPGIVGVLPPQPATDTSGLQLISAMPQVDPSDPALGATVERLRADLPDTVLVGGAAVENLDLQQALSDATPKVIGIVMILGWLLLVVALRAPVIAALGTLASLLSTAAAFGASRLIFQDGIGAGLFGFESQGFLDAWAPVFFFAMIFAIAMDYTVFLLASAKEHWERSGEPHDAMVGSLAHTGRVIFAAAAVMIAVFFTFSLSGPIPPKEMGVILGIAVLLDAFLVRLVLLPVLLRLTGRAGWALPRWLAKILPEITFAH
jgi:RND superfamily putative drug exporter